MVRKFYFFFFLLFLGTHPNLVYSQTPKVETVIAFGTGANQSDALFNAKLNALDQIFGTFISTSTQIVNDSIAMNKVTSITNGQITNYEVLKTEKAENGVITTIRVSANIQNLITFCKTIGVEAKAQGSMYSDNLLTKLNNRDNEIKVLKNFVSTFKQEIPSIFDYNIKPEDPLKATNSDDFLIKVSCELSMNKNFNSVLNVLIDLINQIGIKESELPEFKRNNLEFLPIIIQSEDKITFKYLRSKESQKIILEFVKLIDDYLQNNALVRNDKKELRPYSRIGDNYNFLYYLNPNNTWDSYKFFSSSVQPLSIGKLTYKCDKGEESYLSSAIIKKYDLGSCFIISDSLLQSQKFEYENKINIETPFFVISSKCANVNNNKIKFIYNDWVTLDVMKKIESYSIRK